MYYYNISLTSSDGYNDWKLCVYPVNVIDDCSRKKNQNFNYPLNCAGGAIVKFTILCQSVIINYGGIKIGGKNDRVIGNFVINTRN